MEFIENGFERPNEDNNIFTIYSKSGCINCRNVKDLLQKHNFTFNIIDCDEYLI